MAASVAEILVMCWAGKELFLCFLEYFKLVFDLRVSKGHILIATRDKDKNNSGSFNIRG